MAYPKLSALGCSYKGGRIHTLYGAGGRGVFTRLAHPEVAIDEVVALADAVEIKLCRTILYAAVIA